jgi:hypothetical protein
MDTEQIMEVELIDVNGDTHIYWIYKKNLPYDDDIDTAIELAIQFHTKEIGTEIPEDDYSNEDDPDIYRTAYDAFTRPDDEYTWVTAH